MATEFFCIIAVNPSHIKFQADLKEALEQLICKKSESILMVDDLVEKLQNRFPGIQGFERANILSNISRLYGKKVEYMGKKKRYLLLLEELSFGWCFNMVSHPKTMLWFYLGCSHDHLTITLSLICTT